VLNKAAVVHETLLSCENTNSTKKQNVFIFHEYYREMTKVVRLQRRDGTIVQDCDVYIGRSCNMGGWRLKQSKWKNPYSVKKHGREEAIRLYEEYLRGNKDLMAALPELEGKVLGCWCKPQGTFLAGHTDQKLAMEMYW
jgi:hypothetical protein